MRQDFCESDEPYQQGSDCAIHLNQPRRYAHCAWILWLLIKSIAYYWGTTGSAKWAAILLHCYLIGDSSLPHVICVWLIAPNKVTALKLSSRCCLLQEDPSRAEAFRDYAARRKESVWTHFLNMLNRPDHFIVNQVITVPYSQQNFSCAWLFDSHQYCMCRLALNTPLPVFGAFTLSRLLASSRRSPAGRAAPTAN